MTNPLSGNRLRWFNERWAVVDIGGKCRILRTQDAIPYDEQNFKLSVASEHGGQGERLAVLWLRHPRRRTYRLGLEFDPSKPMTDDPMNKDGVTHYNLWTGFPIEPLEGDVQLFLSFVHDVICNDDGFLRDWVLDWLADLVKNPGDKPGSALVLRGAQGVGKGTFAEIVGTMLGRHYMPIGDPELLVGKFGGHLIDKLLVYADEGSFEAKNASTKLKHMITERDLVVEAKFQTPIVVKNSMRIMISGNADQLIKAGQDERRYCIIDVNPRHQNDTPYFEKLRAWADNGGVNALLHFLLNREITSNLRQVPNTKALQDHKLAGMSDVEKWWFDKLNQSVLVARCDWIDTISIRYIHSDYINSMGWKSSRGSETAFGKALKRMIPRMTITRATVKGHRQRCYRFPPLNDCRQDFIERFGLDPDVFDDGPALRVVSDDAEIDYKPEAGANEESES